MDEVRQRGYPRAHGDPYYPILLFTTFLPPSRLIEVKVHGGVYCAKQNPKTDRRAVERQKLQWINCDVMQQSVEITHKSRFKTKLGRKPFK